MPVSVAGDELPLPDEPGTRPLLTLLRCALQPGTLDEQTAAELLTGPLGGTDALGLRRLRRGYARAAPAQCPTEAGRASRTLRPGSAALNDPRSLLPPVHLRPGRPDPRP